MFKTLHSTRDPTSFQTLSAEALRPVAQALFRSGDDEDRAWALQKILGPCYDPAIDGELQTFRRSFWTESLEPLIWQDLDLLCLFLDLAREELVSGLLKLSEANQLFMAIRRAIDEQGAAPISEIEWDNLEALKRTAPRETERDWLALFAYVRTFDGRWSPFDTALLEEGLERSEAEPFLVGPLADALMAHPIEDGRKELEILERLLLVAQGDEMRYVFHQALRTAKGLGIQEETEARLRAVHSKRMHRSEEV
ncbi:MAG: hypothetical protein HY791_34090 [Deltaproteobacteria bacterium]|nr:hypothetical protein [Deltaproteobacteria bacterium]